MEVDSEEATSSSTAKTTTKSDAATDLFTIVELALRDQILELEERLFFGTLGSLKIRDRQAWQSALQNGSYDMQCDGLSWGGKSMVNTPFESRMVSATASREQSRPGTPDSNQRDSGGSFVKRQNKKVYELASAILQVAQMCEAKYFKQPLGKNCTVWKFQDFSVIQILREIDFGECKSSKSNVFRNLLALNFGNLVSFSLLKVQRFIKIKIHSLQMC